MNFVMVSDHEAVGKECILCFKTITVYDRPIPSGFHPQRRNKYRNQSAVIIVKPQLLSLKSLDTYVHVMPKFWSSL